MTKIGRFRVGYHFRCFYWFVLDEWGNELYWAMNKEDCVEWAENHSMEDDR